MKKIIKWFKSSSSDFVLFLVFLVLINLVSQKSFLRFDLSAPKSYSLSKASISLVKNLEEPLSVRVFFDKNLPAPYNNVSQYVSDLLEEYKRAANKNFSVTYMDLSKEENIALAVDFGLKEVQIQEVKNNEIGFKQAFMGLVISYGDSIEILDPISSDEGFEYKFTSTISKMINTVDSLASLSEDEKITVTVYLNNELKDMGINGIDKIEEITRTVCDEISIRSMGKVSYNYVSPNESSIDELVEQYGIQKIRYSGDKVGVVGIVVEGCGKFKLLPVQVQQSIFGYIVAGLENISTEINESIQAIVSKPTQIGYIMGHNELPLNEEKYAANFDRLVSKMYEFVELDLLETDIPSGISCIVINGPQIDYYEEELYKIDQFIMKGGNVMFLIDGLNTVGAAAYYNGTPQYVENKSNLDKLLNKYGVKRGYDFVMDKNCFVNTNPQYGKLNLHWAPVLQKGQMPKKHPITSNLGYVTMLQNSSLDATEAKANEDLKVTVLAKSSEESWLEEKLDIILNPMMIVPPQDTSLLKSYDLALLLEGNFESAYDETPIFEDEDSEDLDQTSKSSADNMIENAHLSSSKLPGKVFVIGTSYVTTYQVMDENGISPTSMFMMNVVDYLNGNEDLCTMRTKGLSVNVLDLKSPILAELLKYFNQYGLAVIVAIVGLLVWRSRTKRKIRINKKYNPNDERTVSSKEEKKIEK